MVCEFCYQDKPDVCERACGYEEDVNNDPTHIEVICDDCEQEHLDNI